jgi:hypothetical protein
VVSYADQ